MTARETLPKNAGTWQGNAAADVITLHICTVKKNQTGACEIARGKVECSSCRWWVGCRQPSSRPTWIIMAIQMRNQTVGRQQGIDITRSQVMRSQRWAGRQGAAGPHSLAAYGNGMVKAWYGFRQESVRVPKCWVQGGWRSWRPVVASQIHVLMGSCKEKLLRDTNELKSIWRWSVNDSKCFCKTIGRGATKWASFYIKSEHTKWSACSGTHVVFVSFRSI
jgi:hypothetical protein